MKKFTLITLILISFLDVFSQQDQKAKDILDKLSETTAKYTDISIDFIFTLENKEEEIKEVNEGSVAMKGTNYKLVMPALGMEIFSDGTTSWNYLPDAEELNIIENDPEDEEALNPANLFSIYKKGFNYKYIGVEVVNGKSSYLIELTPKNKEKDFTSIKLYIEKSKYRLLKALTYSKDGNQYTFEMKNMKTDSGLPDSYFRFEKEKYPNVEIIDMR
jgi:outer membrane lipoprotein-sorting protein